MAIQLALHTQLPFSAGILPDGGEGPVKRSVEGGDSTRDIKQRMTALNVNKKWRSATAK